MSTSLNGWISNLIVISLQSFWYGFIGVFHFLCQLFVWGVGLYILVPHNFSLWIRGINFFLLNSVLLVESLFVLLVTMQCSNSLSFFTCLWCCLKLFNLKLQLDHLDAFLSFLKLLDIFRMLTAVFQVTWSSIYGTKICSKWWLIVLLPMQLVFHIMSNFHQIREF